MKRNTVLFALSLCPNRIGGMEAFCRELATQLLAQGSSLVLCFEGHPSAEVQAYLLEPGNVTLDVLPQQARMDLRGLRAFWSMLRRYRPSSLVYTLGGAVRWWPLLGRFAGVRRAFYYDQSSRNEAAMSYRASVPVRWLMRPLTMAVCATHFIKGCSDRENIVPSAKSTVIFNSVKLDPLHGEGAPFRERFGISADRILIMKISWLVPDKGIDVALRGAQQALRQRSDLHFVFCGDGEYRQQYQQTAAELGLDDHVTWAGQVLDLPASGAFRAADIQIQCSQWHEAFCLAVAEGMCAGLPVVASRMGGLPELVQDGLNGFLFEKTSSAELAQAILKLADNKELRTHMGQQGRARVTEHYNVVENVRRWTKLLAS